MVKDLKTNIFVAISLLLIAVTGIISSDETTTAGESPLQISKDSAYSLVQSRFETLKPIFERSCFDCHSNKTDYPWYHSIPVVKGFIDGHIEEAREYINFSSEFPFLGKLTPKQQLGEILSEVADGDMPLLSYRLLHWNTKLSDEEVDSVAAWVSYSLEILSKANE